MGQGDHPPGTDLLGQALDPYLTDEEFVEAEWEPAPRWGIILAIVLWTMGIGIWVGIAIAVGWI